MLCHRATPTDTSLTFILRQNLDTLPNLSISLESPASWVAGITSIYHQVQGALRYLIFLFLLLFETASHCVGHPGLELFSSSADLVIPRSSCLSLPGAEIRGMSHHSQLLNSALGNKSDRKVFKITLPRKPVASCWCQPVCAIWLLTEGLLAQASDFHFVLLLLIAKVKLGASPLMVPSHFSNWYISTWAHVSVHRES